MLRAFDRSPSVCGAGRRLSVARRCGPLPQASSLRAMVYRPVEISAPILIDCSIDFRWSITLFFLCRCSEWCITFLLHLFVVYFYLTVVQFNISAAMSLHIIFLHRYVNCIIIAPMQKFVVYSFLPAVQMNC